MKQIMRAAAIAAFSIVAAALRAERAPSISQAVFVGGAEGPHGTPHYRIPTLAALDDGTLLAFAEGRHTPQDPGSGYPISMNCKRSADHGRTWSAIQVLAGDPAHAFSDPRVLVDRRHNRVFLFYTQWPVAVGSDKVPTGIGPESSVLYYRASDDGGMTWSAPVNLNPALKNPAWHMLASIVGVGAQLDRQTPAEGGANGRLIFAAGVIDGGGIFHDVSVYSDDFGRTWQISPSLTPNHGASESDLIELADGRLLLGARNDGKGPPSRYHYLSHDGGRTWILGAPVAIKVTKVDCGLVYFQPQGVGGSNCVLITGPFGTPVGSGLGRSNLGVWKSADEGVSFSVGHQLFSGYTAYSQIVQLSGSKVGIIFESARAATITYMEWRIDDL